MLLSQPMRPNVARTFAISDGVVTNYSGNQTVWFEWGPTTTLGYTTPTKIVSSHQSLVSSQISGLTPGKAYFYRIKSNSGEMGDIRAFITLLLLSLTTSGGTTTTTSNGMFLVRIQIKQMVSNLLKQFNI